MKPLPEKLFRTLLKQNHLPMPESEFEFARPARKWRFDYCWTREKVALEVEGAIWTRGRHTRGTGFLKDMEKYNEAARMGYVVVRTTPDDLCTNATISLVSSLLAQRVA